MENPNPDYDDHGQREVRISFKQIERELDGLHMVVGEEIEDAERDEDGIVFTLEQDDF